MTLPPGVPSAPGPSAGYPEAALAWARHLRGGGSTPWLEFLAGHRLEEQGPRVGAGVPGAAQLELVRLLAARAHALASPPDPDRFTSLADDVFGRAVAGRGLGDRPLLWPPHRTAHHTVAPGRHGAPPIDPAALPVGELLRTAAGVVADQLVARGTVPRPPVHPPRGRPRAWAPLRRVRRYRVVGVPSGVERVRAALAGAGHPDGGPLGGRHAGPVFVVVDTLDELLAQAWAARVRQGARTRWRTYVGGWVARGELPRAAAVDDLAARWAQRVGAERVHVVAGAADAAPLVAAVLGVPPGPGAMASVGLLPPAQTDVVRRVNAVLRVRVTTDHRRALDRRLVTVLAAGGPVPAPGGLQVPHRHRSWAADAAERLADRLAAGGYPVHGDLGVLRRPAHGPVAPLASEVLEEMLGALSVLGGVAAQAHAAPGVRR